MPRGSNPGERRGGRQRGTPNKKTALKNAAIGAAAANPNLSPLDFLLALMRDPNLDLEVRVTVAEAALPLVHTKPKEPSQKKSVTAKYGTSRNGVNAHNGGVDSSAPNAEAAKAGVPVNEEIGNAE